MGRDSLSLVPHQTSLSLSLSKATRVAFLPLVLAACSRGDQPPDPKQPADGDEHIACAVGGQTEFRPVCAVERSKQDGTLVLTVRHPDGAFRRFDVLADGRGLSVADGAQQAVARYEGGFAELAVDGDRYRFPFTLKSDAGKF